MPAPRNIAALALAVSLAAPAALATTFTQGPYLQLPRLDAMTVVWVQDPPGTGEVRFGPEGAALAEVGQIVASATAAARHEVTLTGLDPDTRYDYEVVLDDATSETATFSTAVPPGTPFRWALYGDTRSSHDDHAKVVAAMVAEPDVRFGVQTGDMVSSGEIPEEWDVYFSVEQPFMRSVPVFPVIGNHDEFEGAAPELLTRFVAPENSPRPEEYYSFTYGNAWFTVLDGHVNLLLFDGCLAERDLFVLDCMTPEQIDWVEADLTAAAQAPNIDHIFVLVHIGPYSSKENRSGSMDVRRLLPLFKEMGVTAVLSGHDHYYERGLSAYGMPYIISGGAGAGLYDLATPSSAPHEVAANESVHHHVIVDVDGLEVTFTARRTDGSLLDTVTLPPPADECAVDADCAAVEPPPDCFPPAWCSVAKRCAFECAVEGLNPFPELSPDATTDAGSPDATGGSSPDSDDAGPDTDEAGPELPAEDQDAPAGPDDPDDDAAPVEADPGTAPPPPSNGCAGTPGAPAPSALLVLLAALAAASRRRRPCAG